MAGIEPKQKQTTNTVNVNSIVLRYKYCEKATIHARDPPSRSVKLTPKSEQRAETFQERPPNAPIDSYKVSDPFQLIYYSAH